MVPDVSIITTCKGRLHHLKWSLPFMLAQEGDVVFDVIVVDYGCPDGAFDWCSQYPDPRLKAIGVNTSVSRFNLNRARNIGAKFSMAPRLCFVDCDLLLPPDHLDAGLAFMGNRDVLHYVVDPNATGNGPFYIHQPTLEQHASSSVSRIMRSSLFRSLRGYDEEFKGWGWDDVDLTIRARAMKATEAFFHGKVAFLNHNADDSVRFYDEKDKATSAAGNHTRMQQTRNVNPGRWGIPGDDTRYHSDDSCWMNPNFIDIAHEDHPGCRGDRQAGWHHYVGEMVESSHILDVGSGLGLSRQRLAGDNNNVTLLEPHPDFPSDLKCPLSEIADKSYDVVTAFDVLEHVPNDWLFLNHCRRIARNMVFVTTPNMRSSQCANWFHAREYTPPQLVALAEMNGGCVGTHVSDARDGTTARPVTHPEFLTSQSPTLAVAIGVA